MQIPLLIASSRHSLGVRRRMLPVSLGPSTFGWGIRCPVCAPLETPAAEARPRPDPV